MLAATFLHFPVHFSNTSFGSNSPIAVSVAADPWMAYSSGVFSGCPKAPRNVIINHGVQLVGYGTDAGKDYCESSLGLL